MKLGPVTKIDKRNKTNSKKIYDNVMSENCDLIAILPIYGQLEQFECRIPDIESIKHVFSLIVTFYLTKTENRTIISLTQLSHYCFE